MELEEKIEAEEKTELEGKAGIERKRKGSEKRVREKVQNARIGECSPNGISFLSVGLAHFNIPQFLSYNF
jgi:hypothetical protein